MRTAILFPGQGSHVDDMREAVEATSPGLLELADELVGEDPFERIEDGTRFAQPALYCSSIALWERAGRPGADCFAGHSLGEVAALVAAGSIAVDDGLRLAVRRGELMGEAADAAPDGGMLAVLGDDDAARAIASLHRLAVANDNAPGQIVLSGPDDELRDAAGEAKSHGIRTIRLSVRGAFHSPAMAPVIPKLRQALAGIEVRPPRVPVLSGVTAEPIDDVRNRLAEALVSPVRWREVLAALERRGIGRFVEIGPGKVLKGLVRRTLPDAEALTLADLEPAHA
jgi:malonyl CoA-acyl carrier protein transacylase